MTDLSEDVRQELCDRLNRVNGNKPIQDYPTIDDLAKTLGLYVERTKFGCKFVTRPYRPEGLQ